MGRSDKCNARAPQSYRVVIEGSLFGNQCFSLSILSYAAIVARSTSHSLAPDEASLPNIPSLSFPDSDLEQTHP